ncbi:MAG TPA: class I SAM-dependent methyltransferase [Spirochaetota bacterium]|jgi:23S rRNA (cytosine1962-C5)-methyltransferase|nr:class I SAM-dependent methyltransferase [Spirochaetota bacterium]HPJ15740.1 class I SAM-dependent methyltransferase [Spirochaetota bacterium]HPM35487.1 class I SAM-dependent methyltransferase [Spirochaetota bacterium]HPW51495.1 class I SAM-dependent methyltransferase [Spirochaetota bacterium]HQO21483.1 class I SAM-dependent methyltransferase [Spirochaetota bacterium]
MKTQELIKKAFERRLGFFSSEETVFRLINGDGDGLYPCTADYYDGFILIQDFDGNSGLPAELLKIIPDVCSEYSLPVKGILLKNRGRLSPGDDIEAKRKSIIIDGESPADEIIVRHMGLDISVDIINSQNTGLFFDMRYARSELLKYYADFESMLNLFSYTCVFSLHALKNSVRRAVNVDISKPVLSRGMRNYELNGLTVDSRDFVKGKSSDLIKYYKKKDIHFSLSVIDPPTFARSQKGSFSAERDLSSYLRDLSGISDYVFSAVNTFKTDERTFLSMHPENYELVFSANEAEDFPHSGSPYLKTALWKIR